MAKKFSSALVSPSGVPRALRRVDGCATARATRRALSIGPRRPIDGGPRAMFITGATMAYSSDIRLSKVRSTPELECPRMTC